MRVWGCTIKVLFVIRENAKKISGGDLIQLEFTKKYLEKKGLNCQVAFGTKELDDLIGSFDIVHLFNLQTPLTTLEAIKIAKKRKKKICLSTIYFNIYGLVAGVLLTKLHSIKLYKYNFVKHSLYNTYSFFAYPLFNLSFSVLKKYGDSPLNPSFRKIVKEILLDADVILPNSLEELNQLISDFYEIPSDVLRKKSHIVVNGVDIEEIEKLNEDCVSESSRGLIEKLKTKHKFIIGEVGRIEGIKNQLSLAKAFYGRDDFAIILAGMYRGNDSYYKNIKKIAQKCKNIYIIGPLSRCDTIYLMKNLDVHVLPSLRETPGLVSLEAASLGTPVVTTMYSPNSEYLSNYAFVCNPLDAKDIREKTILALQMPEDTRTKMRNYVLNNFTWERASMQTLETYMSILEK